MKKFTLQSLAALSLLASTVLAQFPLDRTLTETGKRLEGLPLSDFDRESGDFVRNWLDGKWYPWDTEWEDACPSESVFRA